VAQFVLEAVSELKASLRQLGSDLVVAVGKPEEVIAGRRRGGCCQTLRP
jgi:hypothetical protein